MQYIVVAADFLLKFVVPRRPSVWRGMSGVGGYRNRIIRACKYGRSAGQGTVKAADNDYNWGTALFIL